jgi:hypothetical protein
VGLPGYGKFVAETTVSFTSRVDCLTRHRSDLSQMLRICDRWSCDQWMFLYRNVPCVSRLFLCWGSPVELAFIWFWVSSVLFAQDHTCAINLWLLPMFPPSSRDTGMYPLPSPAEVLFKYNLKPASYKSRPAITITTDNGYLHLQPHPGPEDAIRTTCHW